MELRNGSLVGGSPGKLPQAMRPIFEEGVRMVLQRWTALCLAVENEWGGRDSRLKADQMYQDILAWFYDHSEHYADDLEVDLEEIMLADFHTETEDDSPREVSKELVALHNDLLTGNSAAVARLQRTLPAAVTSSVRQTRDRDGTVVEGDESSSGSDDDDDMGVADGQGAMGSQQQQQQQQAPEPRGPIIDDDGFQLVQGRKSGRNR